MMLLLYGEQLNEPADGKGVVYVVVDVHEHCLVPGAACELIDGEQYPQTARRDVGEVGAIDEDVAILVAVDLGQALLNLTAGSGVELAFECDDSPVF